MVSCNVCKCIYISIPVVRLMSPKRFVLDDVALARRLWRCWSQNNIMIPGVIDITKNDDRDHDERPRSLSTITTFQMYHSNIHHYTYLYCASNFLLERRESIWRQLMTLPTAAAPIQQCIDCIHHCPSNPSTRLFLLDNRLSDKHQDGNIVWNESVGMKTRLYPGGFKPCFATRRSKGQWNRGTISRHPT